ncbi:hypothetical protein QCA50_012937 [Cerrena zonata]|uniref:PH domain-containing protein n=1 Tax=Cerrena zonata TaxID=2478898 RepID=A0AAW0FT64_9APHY
MNAVKKFGSNHGSPKKNNPKSPETAKSGHQRSGTSTTIDNLDEVSPELVPIVTLLSSQSHRRYHEGLFMLYHDLNGDGKPADREWKEVYGILTGNQLAYWDAANLAAFRNSPDALLDASAKPNYLNFTDSIFNAMKNLPAAKQNLENVIIVSTTLKNRYIIQFKSYKDLIDWHLSLRLANYEYQSLQEAYTGALLSARGSRLSDIRTVLAEKRFDHEDWVSIRYGSGMAWKRCYAVVEPSNPKKKNFQPGRIVFYENDQKKKKQLMAEVTSATSVTAVYPSSHLLVDHSTMLKLECSINFKSPSVKPSSKNLADITNTSVFLMPEQHSAVPGFDTLIRFLIPLLDAFGLYGRPKRLKADRVDPESLLFGLPTLPHVHYLNLDDLEQLASRPDWLSWDVGQWTQNLKNIMKLKLDRGYEGCGSARGFGGAVNSLKSPKLGSPNSATFKGSPLKNSSSSRSQTPLRNDGILAHSNHRPPPPPAANGKTLAPAPGINPSEKKNPNNLTINPPNNSKEQHKSIHLAEIYNNYNEIESPSDQFQVDRNKLLNGGPGEIKEEDLPSRMQKINLAGNGPGPAYPKDDHELFSDDDSDDEPKQVGKYPGIPQNPGLAVPSYGSRNGSYSSVQSPMTQYNEFNQQFNKQVVDPHKPPFASSDDDRSETESPPPIPPPHQNQQYPPNQQFSQNKQSNIQKSKPSYNLANNTQTPPVLSPNKPRYITSPNHSQNQLPRFQTHDTSVPGSAPTPVPAPAPVPQGYQQGAPPQQRMMRGPVPPQQYGAPPPQQYGAPHPQQYGAPHPQQQIHPQQPPQGNSYPNSLQFGYQAPPQPQPQPQPHPYQGRPPMQGYPPNGYPQGAPMGGPRPQQFGGAPGPAPGPGPAPPGMYQAGAPPPGGMKKPGQQKLSPAMLGGGPSTAPGMGSGMPRPQPQNAASMRAYGNDGPSGQYQQGMPARNNPTGRPPVQQQGVPPTSYARRY